MNLARDMRPRMDQFNALSGGCANAADAGFHLDMAISLFRKAMPGHGLKLLLPPPLPGGSFGHLSLSAWRRIDQSARVHSGKSAREAMKLLFDSQSAADYRERLRKHCPCCRGAGWYIASDGIEVICTHP